MQIIKNKINEKIILNLSLDFFNRKFWTEDNTFEIKPSKKNKYLVTLQFSYP